MGHAVADGLARPDAPLASSRRHIRRSLPTRYWRRCSGFIGQWRAGRPRSTLTVLNDRLPECGGGKQVLRGVARATSISQLSNAVARALSALIESEPKL